MKTTLIFFVMSLFITSSLISGTPINTVIAGLQTNTNNIRVGEEVIFSFGGTDNCDEGFALIYDFGPNAMPMEHIEIINMGSMPVDQISVVFNVPGPVNVTLDVSQSLCRENRGFPFILPINVLPEAIPTLSQWALMLLTLLIVIFAVLSIRSSQFQSSYHNRRAS
jgi:hypothetical protein